MRMALLTIGVLIGGAGVGMYCNVIPIPERLADAVRALGGDPTQWQSRDTNPIHTVYDNVVRLVSVPEHDDDQLARPGVPPASAADLGATRRPATQPVPTTLNGIPGGPAPPTQKHSGPASGGNANTPPLPQVWHPRASR